MFIVEEGVELKDAEKNRLALLAAIDGYEDSDFSLDLTGAEPTQVALQLTLAGLKELKARGITPQPGAALSSVLEQQFSALTKG